METIVYFTNLIYISFAKPYPTVAETQIWHATN